MKRLNDNVWIGFAGLFVLLISIAGCTGATSLKNLSPIQPLATLPENIVIDTTTDPKHPEMSITQEGITVSIAYWRRTDLDRKYNRGNAVSPFYESEALHQGDKTDVFYVKITNNSDQPLRFKVKGDREVPTEIIDQGDNRYGAQDYDDLQERLTLMSRVSGLYVKNGLAKAREILLEKQIGDVDEGVAPGVTIEGFLPFQQIKPNATSLDVVIPLKKMPPKGTTARFKTLVYKFPFTHDRGIRVAQPPPHRY